MIDATGRGRSSAAPTCSGRARPPANAPDRPAERRTARVSGPATRTSASGHGGPDGSTWPTACTLHRRPGGVDDCMTGHGVLGVLTSARLRSRSNAGFPDVDRHEGDTNHDKEPPDGHAGGEAPRSIAQPAEIDKDPTETASSRDAEGSHTGERRPCLRRSDRHAAAIAARLTEALDLGDLRIERLQPDRSPGEQSDARRSTLMRIARLTESRRSTPRRARWAESVPESDLRPQLAIAETATPTRATTSCPSSPRRRRARR